MLTEDEPQGIPEASMLTEQRVLQATYHPKKSQILVSHAVNRKNTKVQHVSEYPSQSPQK